MPPTVIPFPTMPAKSSGVTVHDVRIGRAVLGWAAVCSCGWCAAGFDKRRLEEMAAGHDLNENIGDAP